MNVLHLLTAAFWAGVIALDFTAFGPFMVSQPMVCGPLFGWLLGNVGVGILIGGIMQLLWMDLSPVGVGIPYDATASTLLAVYWASLPGHSALSQVALCMAVAVPFGFLFRWVDQGARRMNTRIMHKVDDFSDERLPTGLWFGVGAGILWSWVRYTALYAAVFVMGDLFWDKWQYIPKRTAIDQGLTLAMILLPVAGLGITLELFLAGDSETSGDARRTIKYLRKDD
jgi:mannose/fructose/N-acetylgalactosamine-specific phosphotransferase system component IIC